MSGFMDAVYATLSPDGAVYAEGAGRSVKLGRPVIPGLDVSLGEYPAVVDAVREAAGSDRLAVKGMHVPMRMPWHIDQAGREFSVGDVLGQIGEEGWLGYDTHVDEVRVTTGIGRWGRRVVRICLFGGDLPVGSVEAYALSERKPVSPQPDVCDDSDRAREPSFLSRITGGLIYP